MPAAYATIALNDINSSTDSEIEEFHAITRLIVFARENAAVLDAQQTVYCLDLALEQIATELRHRADSSADVVPYLQDVSRQRQ